MARHTMNDDGTHARECDWCDAIERDLKARCSHRLVFRLGGVLKCALCDKTLTGPRWDNVDNPGA